ncbi:hypothetical protein LguiB_018416 [Lonicera macranthoides]
MKSVTPPVIVCVHKGEPTLGILPSNWTMCPWLDEFPRLAEQVLCATTSQMVSPREVVGLLMVITLLGYRLVVVPRESDRRVGYLRMTYLENQIPGPPPHLDETWTRALDPSGLAGFSVLGLVRPRGETEALYWRVHSHTTFIQLWDMMGHPTMDISSWGRYGGQLLVSIKEKCDFFVLRKKDILRLTPFDIIMHINFIIISRPRLQASSYFLNTLGLVSHSPLNDLFYSRTKSGFHIWVGRERGHGNISSSVADYNAVSHARRRLAVYSSIRSPPAIIDNEIQEIRKGIRVWDSNSSPHICYHSRGYFIGRKPNGVGCHPCPAGAPPRVRVHLTLPSFL